MKKLITALMVLLVTASLLACSDGGDLKGFLSKTDGDWYSYGNSANALLRVKEDGTWEFFAPNDDNEKELMEWGNIIYDSEYKSYFFEVEESGVQYICELNDGLMMIKGDTFVAAHESRNLSEWFNGNWYQDGKEDGDYYEFTDGDWRFWKGHASTDDGALFYRGGDKKTLTCIDFYEDEPFEVFTVISEDEIKTKDGKVFKYDPDSASSGDSEEDAFVLLRDTLYLKDGEEYTGGYIFFSDGNLEFHKPGNETRFGTYTVDWYLITVTWSDTGDEETLFIEYDGSVTDGNYDSYMLYEEE